MKVREYHVYSSKYGNFWMFVYEALNEAYVIQKLNFETFELIFKFNFFKDWFSASELHWVENVPCRCYLVGEWMWKIVMNTKAAKLFKSFEICKCKG